MRGVKTGGLVLALLAMLGVAGTAQAASTGRHGVVTCDTTAGGVSVVPANGNRRMLVLRNASTTVAIAIGQGIPSTLTTANGLLIPGTATPYWVYLDDYQGPLRCISGSTANLEFMELVN